ncbi:hypothetical protein HY837_03855 [archaeon]|nr:hypothetical protein [archaeon]
MSQENLEQKTQSLPFKEKLKESFKALPIILGCTGGIFVFLHATDCSSVANRIAPQELNFFNYLAGGAGLYGGFVNQKHKKLTSIAALLTSFAPEIKEYFSQPNTDLKTLGLLVGVKSLSYGLFYTVGYFGQKED